MSEEIYNQILARYTFAIPIEYRRLEERGLFNLPAPAHALAFYKVGSYLWLNDMEWYRPKEILDFHFESYHLPGFVPFAFTGGGDYWCWHPAHSDDRGTPVLLCPHDDLLAEVYAPDFQTALYRQILEFCQTNEEDLDASALLRRWAEDLAAIFPVSWCEQIRQLANDPERSRHAAAFERAAIALNGKAAEIQWMRP